MGLRVTGHVDRDRGLVLDEAKQVRHHVPFRDAACLESIPGWRVDETLGQGTSQFDRLDAVPLLAGEATLETKLGDYVVGNDRGFRNVGHDIARLVAVLDDDDAIAPDGREFQSVGVGMREYVLDCIHP